ncbi:outer membrane lipoprotein-sorting protein [candidate division TA06 bacterium]|uniref:Outer membrane lipoprotein-sorting protein n=1 Tax=candidate division TA06 bacterium TaxID=2250710 RepID=A0A660S6D0_UNCT6|nr:MAG: outer membrane lipoprotein-sorting protein [candidate division TA06 bacterium]
MKIFYKVIIVVLFPIFVFSMTANELLKRIDNRHFYSTISYKAIMKIHFANETLEKHLSIYVKGNEKAYLEIIYPPEERGTRYLKLKDAMWIYFPSADDVIRISGHMLRQSMFGSDLSYEDASSSKKLSEYYDATYDTSRTNDTMYVLDLIAKEKDASYYRRKVYVSKGSLLIKKMELFAKSGKLLRTMKFENYKKYGSIYVPMKMEVRDEVRKNSYTDIMLFNVKIDVILPSRMFTKSYLRRKS